MALILFVIAYMPGWLLALIAAIVALSFFIE
jgi:hypothetical protein